MAGRVWGGTAGGGVWRRLPGEAEPDWREEIGLYRESGKALFRCEHREAWAGSEPQRAGREKGGTLRRGDLFLLM